MTNKSTKEKLKLRTWYTCLDGVERMLVLEYPWWHLRRLQGYRFRDNDGHFRTKLGNIRDDKLNLLDISISSRLAQDE